MKVAKHAVDVLGGAFRDIRWLDHWLAGALEGHAARVRRGDGRGDQGVAAVAALEQRRHHLRDDIEPNRLVAQIGGMQNAGGRVGPQHGAGDRLC